MESKNKQKRAMITRESIIDAGIQLFSEKGYYQTNSKEIAKLAGVSIGSFYTYFTDKKQLITEIIKTYTEEMEYSTTNCSEEECSNCNEDIARYFLNKVLSVAKKYPLSFHKEMDIVIYREEDLKEFWKEYYENKISVFAKILESLGEDLRILDYKECSKIVFGVSNQMIYEYLNSEDEEERENIIQGYVELLKRYLYN